MPNSHPNSSMALAKKKKKGFPSGCGPRNVPRAVRHTPGMSQDAVIQVVLCSVLFSEGQQIFHSGSKGHLPSWVKKLCSISRKTKYLKYLVWWKYSVKMLYWCPMGIQSYQEETLSTCVFKAFCTGSIKGKESVDVIVYS